MSVEALAGGDKRHEGVHAELLGLGSSDGVCAYAEGGIGGCEQWVDLKTHFAPASGSARVPAR